MKQPDWGMGTSCYKSNMAGTSLDEKKSQFDWPTGDTSFHSKQILHTRELVPEPDLCNRFAPGAYSLISNQFDIREQNSGAKVLLCNIFSLEVVGADKGALLQERAAGARSLVCTGRKNAW